MDASGPMHPAVNLPNPGVPNTRRRRRRARTEPSVFAAVLASAKAGEPWAFEDLFARVGGRLVGFLRALGAADPDGAANEVLLRAFRNIDRFDGSEVEFRAWVFAIARNLLVDERRRAGRRPEAVATDPSELTPLAGAAGIEESAPGVDDDRIRRCLAALSTEQREVLLLRVIADLSIEDTAELLGKTSGAVKALQHRAVRALRKILDQEA